MSDGVEQPVVVLDGRTLTHAGVVVIARGWAEARMRAAAADESHVRHSHWTSRPGVEDLSSAAVRGQIPHAARVAG
jgi:hypothetical protein